MAGSKSHGHGPLYPGEKLQSMTLRRTLFLIIALGFVTTHSTVAQSTIPGSDERNQHWVEIEIKSVFVPLEATGLPGIMFGIAEFPEEFELEKVNWIASHERGDQPIEIRESSSAIFYFPTEGHYTVEVVLLDQSGQIGRGKTTLTLSPERAVTESIHPITGSFRQEVNSHEFREAAQIWEHLELTGTSAKPAQLLGMPWYLPAGLAAGAAGVAILSLSDEDAVPDLLINDLNVAVPCDESTYVFPLSNDVGEDLKMVEVNGLPSDRGRWMPPDRVEIFSGQTSSFSFSYIAEDGHGQNGSAGVQVDLIFPELIIPETVVEVEAGQAVSGNLLENALCSDCRIVGHEPPASGSLERMGAEFTYVSEPDFGGTIKVNFEIVDECGQEKTSSLSIVVHPQCISSFSFETQAADCGLENGSVQLVSSSEGQFSFLWNTGETSESLDGLSAGQYDLTITDENNGCIYEREFTVEEEPFDYLVGFQTIDGSCVESGNALFELFSPGDGPVELLLTFSGGTLEGQTGGSGQRTSLKELWPDHFFRADQYQITVFDQEAGSDCAQQKSFTLEEKDLPMTLADDHYSVYEGSELTGNVLENDNGTDLRVIDYEEVEFGTLQIGENGDFSFVSERGENGLIEVEYTASDSCGQSKTAVLSIEVLSCQISVDFEVEAADCQESNGGISALLESPENYTFEWSVPGQSAYIEGLSSGQYFLTLTQKETDCKEEFEIFVETRAPEATDDHFTVVVNDSLEANVLENDMGVGLLVDSHGQPSEGVFDLDEEGNLTFKPGENQSGNVSIWYVIRDSCDQLDSALIHIKIVPPDCEWEYQIEKDSADCGLSNAWVWLTLDTECDYELIWHDGSGEDSLRNQSAGLYELKIILSGEERNTDTVYVEYRIFEKKPVYHSEVELIPANCLNPPDVVMELNSSGQGDFEVVVEGPETQGEYYTSDSTFRLSEWEDPQVGTYRFFIRDLSMDCDMADSLEVELLEEDLPMELQDDHYEMESGSTLEFNVLSNDTGTGLKVIDYEDPPFGNLNIEEKGNGTFTAEIPLHGLISVVYTVEDSCGSISEALLTIDVVLPPCDFSVEFAIADAHCGFDDGALNATVNPAGDYSYSWSNGETTSSISGLPPGTYELTVTDELLECDLEFTAVVNELPSDWIISHEVYPFGCSNEPDIVLDLQSPGDVPLTVTVSGGNIFNQVITVSPGELFLSDHFWLTTGQYTLTVLPVGSAARCSETLSVQLTGISNPVSLDLLQATPPTAPHLSNGWIQIAINDSDTPFELFLNGSYAGSTNQSTHTFQNLGVGTHEIYAVNSKNCQSDTLVVELHSPGRWKFVKSLSGVGSLSLPSGMADVRTQLSRDWAFADAGERPAEGLGIRSAIIHRSHHFTIQRDLGQSRFGFLGFRHSAGREIWGSDQEDTYHYHWGVSGFSAGVGKRYEVGSGGLSISFGHGFERVSGRLDGMHISGSLTHDRQFFTVSGGIDYPLTKGTEISVDGFYYHFLKSSDRPGMISLQVKKEF